MTVIAEPWNWRGGRIQDAFLHAVRTVADLAADPSVAAALDHQNCRPSARGHRGAGRPITRAYGGWFIACAFRHPGR